MKIVKNLSVLALCLAMLAPITGCSTWQGMSKTGQGATAGGAAGAAVGAGIGALAGGGKGAWIGALVGTAVGAGTGAIIGNKMDKQKKQLEESLAQTGTDAQIETVKDSNNLDAIKLVLDNAILFKTGSAALSEASKASLSRIAINLNQNPQTDFTIIGYTDNTGGYDLNMRLSQERADAVRNYLMGQGVSGSRLKSKGEGWANPVATNETAEGRAQNRRVEMFITASQEMIDAASQQ